MRWSRILLFVGSALAAAVALRLAWDYPFAALGLLLGAGTFALTRWVARRRLRRVLESGDVHSVLSSWSRAISRVPHPQTMAPLMTATAFAAYGWADKARAAMAAAERGPAWEAALEHRLFLDTILLTYEGDRDGAIDKATRLCRLPLPTASSALVGRVQLLRVALLAFARAFARRPEPGDGEILETASRVSPLVHWAMRYAAAIVAVDRGDVAKVHALIDKAPTWPDESAFRAFHDEIVAQLGARPGGAESIS